MDTIRKIVKNGAGTYYVSIPKQLMKKLRWKEKQKVVISEKGKTLIVKDWEE